ncbi:outer membrane protein assembly factor BamB family protein [Haloarchaeobius amylolyticus]|uniref:outer membrane protein assembly factor BamB family protein n=1 Tax=Haloarchaeobius amylolyticus TaxID=1198296 RepID=UPI00226EE9A9|nr:PQQ-binding-like beta-propeller repeat protein [Haloarchaeobius amylolyticus]
MKRRDFLRGLAATGSLAALAGCNRTGGDAADLPGVGRADGCGAYEPTVEGTPGWHTVGGDPAGTGVAPAAAGPETPFSVDWTFPIDGVSGTTRPAVADGRAYTHDLNSTVYAVDTETGESVWQQGITEPRGSPAVGEAAVVVIAEDHVVGYDPATGEKRWSGPPGNPDLFSGSPVVADGTAFVPYGLSLYALDLADGSILWRHTTGEETVSTPAVVGDTVFYGDDDTYVYALDRASGEMRWRYKTETHIRCNVAVADGTAVTATIDGDVFGFDAATGDRRWAYSVGGEPAVVACDGANAYVGTRSRLYALDPETGTPCWSTGEYAGSYDSGLTIADGKVYVTATVGRDDGTVPAVLDAASGELRWKLDRGPDEDRLGFEHGPVVVDGAVYATGGGANTLRLTRMS